MMLNDAFYTVLNKNLLEIISFIDGDGFLVKELHSNKEFEVRMYGIDAPEIKVCPKLLKDEKELQLPGSLLIKLGYESLNFLKTLLGIGDKIIFIQESNNLKDKYGRHLGYVYLNSGLCVNEIMIKEGYAKPYDDVFCEMLPLLQEWNLQAKASKRGLYNIVECF